MSKIVLDFKKDNELFNETAKKWAESIGKEIKTTQIRKFFDQVLELNNKAKHCDDFEGEILPFVKMLNSKVAYASARSSGGAKLINKPFVEMMDSCITQVNNKNSLNTFKLFFESIIGFHKCIESEKENNYKGYRQ